MIVRATAVTVDYSGRRVLDAIDLALPAGEHCALRGRSGSGKTTLLLVLAGLLQPTSGTVSWDVTADQVVYVPQAPSLLPELSALQNASLGLRLRGTSPSVAVDRAREQLHALKLDGAEDALPSELSGGMQQRVALARALAVAPALLLVDEPTGSLDQVTGAHVIGVLLQQGATVLVATHDTQVADRFARQVTTEVVP